MIVVAILEVDSEGYVCKDVTRMPLDLCSALCLD